VLGMRARVCQVQATSSVQACKPLPYGILGEFRQAVEVQLVHDVAAVGLDKPECLCPPNPIGVAVVVSLGCFLVGPVG